MTTRTTCAMCGEPWKEHACGPAHAAIAAELERFGVLTISEAGEIAAARALFEYDRRYMETECKTWDEILRRGFDKGYRDCAAQMLLAYRDAISVGSGGPAQEQP